MRLIRTVAIVLAALTLGPIAMAFGQDLPPGPTTLQPLSRLPLVEPADPYEEAQVLTLDFAPGAWTPLHSHGGLTLVRVLEGEMTRRAHGAVDVFQPGEGWVEEPGDVHAAGNEGSAPARVLVTFLLAAGAPLTTVEGTPSQAAPPGPTPSFQSRRVQLASPAEGFDEAATTVLGFAPGAWTPQHSHGGLTLVGVVEGDMTVRSGGREIVYKTGDLWIEQPGDVHAAGNATSGDARVTVSFLQGRGNPVTTLAAAQANPAPAAQAPRALPRAGDASSAVPGFAAATALILIVVGVYVRRRITHRQGEHAS
jgi:quercetin dioxygenase-like cupin family protein